MDPKENTYCHYSDLPSPMAYMHLEEEEVSEPVQTNDQQVISDSLNSNVSTSNNQHE